MFITICSIAAGVLLLPRDRELMLQTEILRRLRRQPQQRLADVVRHRARSAARRADRWSAATACHCGFEIFRIDRAGAEIRRRSEGRCRSRADRASTACVGVEGATARGVELVDVVVGRLEAVLIGGAHGRDQAVERAARTPAVAPHQLIAVLLVEPLRLLPRVPAALAVVNKRRALGRDRGLQRRAGVGRRGRRCARAGARALPAGDRATHKKGEADSSKCHR